MKTSFLKYFHIFIICLALLFVLVNLVSGFFGVMAQIRREKALLVEPGIQYSEFKEMLKGVRIAGFLTDGNEKPDNNDGQLMLAQYMLAPTILDLDNSNHRYNILSCSTPQAAVGILKIINAKPLGVNIYGKIIAEKNL